MTISSVQSGYGVHKSDFSQTRSQQPSNTTNQGATEKDSVKISSQGKLSKTTSNTNLPLEAFSIPSWMGDYHPEATTLSSDINHDFWNFAGKLESKNMSRTDKTELIKNYLDNDPKHQESLAKERFTSKYESELGEYTSKLGTYFQDSLKENGVESRHDYYEKIVLNNEISEQVHQQVKERLAGDDRMMELMDFFNISL